MRCDFCDAGLECYRGVEASICLVCVEFFFGSLATPRRVPEKLPPPAERIASLQAKLASDPGDADATIQLATLLAREGRKEEAAQLAVQASNRYGELKNPIGIFIALRNAVEWAPQYADIKARFEAAEAALGSGKEAQLATLLGSLAREGAVFAGVQKAEPVTDPIAIRLKEMTASLPERKSVDCRVRNTARPEPDDAAYLARLGKFPGTRCHLCATEKADSGARLYARKKGDRVACETCVRTAAERLAAGAPS